MALVLDGEGESCSYDPGVGREGVPNWSLNFKKSLILDSLSKY